MNKLKEFKENFLEFKNHPILTFQKKLVEILYGIKIEKNNLGYIIKSTNNNIIGIYKNIHYIKVKNNKLIIKYYIKNQLTKTEIELNNVLNN